MTASAASPTTMRTRVLRQGALLFSGFAGAQALSLARNALIGHWLSKGDFGIAATIALMLQLLEQLSDLGADRLIVQAPDGDDPRLVASAHATQVARGALMALVLYLLAAPITAFFGIEQARWALEAAALVPLLKGVMHLDARRYQRQLANRAQMAIEIVPQAVALAATLPVLGIAPDYSAVLWLALLQASAALVVSHLLAERPYRIALDRGHLARLVAFGWPIWLSAFPLLAVYQGDRLVIGRLLGMEDLAAYTTAFMMTMVPGLLAAKVGHALLLPLFSATRGEPLVLARRFVLASEATLVAAALYLTVLTIAGGAILPLVFGPHYTELGAVVGWLAAMWALRMVQAVPGMALMALGHTRPFLIAGLLRAAALPLALLLARHGYGLAGVAAAGVIGELASLLYVAMRVERAGEGLGRSLVQRSALLAPVGLAAVWSAFAVGAAASLAATLLAALAASAAVALLALALFASLREIAASALNLRTAVTVPSP